MKISIIIPNYNGADLLEACLESISKQSYTAYDVAVMDNGSTDKSPEVLVKFSDWVQVIKFKKNVGFSKAVNRGIKACNGELVFVLNNDTILLPNCLASIVESAKNNPDYASFAPSIRDIADINQIHSAGLMFSNRGFGNRSNRHEFLKETPVFCNTFSKGARKGKKIEAKQRNIYVSGLPAPFVFL